MYYESTALLIFTHLCKIGIIILRDRESKAKRTSHLGNDVLSGGGARIGKARIQPSRSHSFHTPTILSTSFPYPTLPGAFSSPCHLFLYNQDQMGMNDNLSLDIFVYFVICSFLPSSLHKHIESSAMKDELVT